MVIVWELPLAQLTGKRTTGVTNVIVPVDGAATASEMDASMLISMVLPALMDSRVSEVSEIATLCALAPCANQSAEIEMLNKATIRRATNGSLFPAVIVSSCEIRAIARVLDD